MISLVLTALPEQTRIAGIHIALGKHGAAAGSAAVCRAMKGEVVPPVVLFTNGNENLVRALAARLREAGAQIELRNEAAPAAVEGVVEPVTGAGPPRSRSSLGPQPVVPRVEHPALAMARYYSNRIDGRTVVLGGVASLALGSILVAAVLLEPQDAKIPVGAGGGLSALARQGGHAGGGTVGAGDPGPLPDEPGAAPRSAAPAAPAVQESIHVVVPPSGGAGSVAGEAAPREATRVAAPGAAAGGAAPTPPSGAADTIDVTFEMQVAAGASPRTPSATSRAASSETAPAAGSRARQWRVPTATCRPA